MISLILAGGVAVGNKYITLSDYWNILGICATTYYHTVDIINKKNKILGLIEQKVSDQ